MSEQTLADPVINAIPPRYYIGLVIGEWTNHRADSLA